MFSELPKLFDRNFVVGFFLPAALLLLGLGLTLNAFDLLPTWLWPKTDSNFFDAAWVVGIVWITAVTLTAINRFWIRLLEGYLRPVSWFKKNAERRFKRDVSPVLSKQQEVDAARRAGDPEPETDSDHARKLRRAVEDFPDDSDFVLATSFGCRYRALEVYSRVVYGLDAISSWAHLEAFMPKEFRENLAEARALLNFSVNVLLGSFVVLATYAFLAWKEISLPWWGIPIAAAIAVGVSYRFALESLIPYGSYVKSAFDLYRAELAKKMGLVIPDTAAEEREMWTDVSRVMQFRSAAAWERLDKYRS